MIELLYITNGINGSGGLERVLSIKTNYLIEHYDYSIHILVLNNSHIKPFYNFNKKIIFHNINTGNNKLTFSVNYYKGIRSIISGISPNIITICDDGLKGLLFPIIFGKKIPLVYERHASYNISDNRDNLSFIYRIKKNILRYLARYGGKQFDKFIVLTKNNLKEWNIPNMHVIPNPLSFYPKTSSALDNKTVIAVGSYSFNKGYDRLVSIWYEVIQKQPDWRLEIYGKGSEIIEKHLKEYNLKNSVTLYKPIKNIENKYLESSILVLPSRSEGFGMVLIEAMACGVPCVSFDCPSGPADIIKHKKNGYLIKNGDINTFSNTLIHLMKDNIQRKRMGLHAKQNAKRYLPENILLQWDKLYKNLIKINK